MSIRSRSALVLAAWIALCVLAAGQRSMPRHVERWEKDRADLARFHDLDWSPATLERRRDFALTWLRFLDALAYERMSVPDRVEWTLLRAEIDHDLQLLGRAAERVERLRALLPWVDGVVALETARRGLATAPPAEVAAALDAIAKAAGTPVEELAGGDGAAVPLWRLREAAVEARRMLRLLDDWWAAVGPYDPEISWWAGAPHERARAAVEARIAELGTLTADDEALSGEPIGRQAVLEDLRHAMIAHTPEELIALAEEHAAWCREQLRAAAAELGHGDDWKAALEEVKADHVAPGRQAAFVAEVAREAVAFCDDLDLMTIPPLCRELWRVEMMPPAAQRSLPFASYGGLRVNVAYPAAGMDAADKTMAMRGNNRAFTRLVVPHELIPGHHLQRFQAEREAPWRRVFASSFSVEGWALYGEMLFWRHGFARDAKERIGHLIWRLHRCARVVVTLRFHLGAMTPEEMVTMLVDEVGLEPSGARAEVRRFVGRDYAPLYPCGYLIGGLQLEALREEMGVGERIPERAFHDAVLAQNLIPIEALRALLLEERWSAGREPSWRFGER